MPFEAVEAIFLFDLICNMECFIIILKFELIICENITKWKEPSTFKEEYVLVEFLKTGYFYVSWSVGGECEGSPLLK